LRGTWQGAGTGAVEEVELAIATANSNVAAIRRSDQESSSYILRLYGLYGFINRNVSTKILHILTIAILHIFASAPSYLSNITRYHQLRA
jgi:hypothetical protein